ncbi:uncharacterized protein [Amphiura filiformis]|uniref:uncharacterized protein n=1 Tax=Amphiura filiformis TaxID=82378 RepID=UPI003B20FC06
MAFSRATYVAKRQTEINPVTELTLVLLGLSGSKKTDVAKQIQYHLKGFSDDDTAGGCEPVPLDDCQTLTGKVLGLHATVVNTRDVTEYEESNRTLGDKIEDFDSGDCVVVMVIGAEDEEDREMQMKQLGDFSKMVFGKEAERFSLGVYTSTTSAARQKTTEAEEQIPEMSFDINADKNNNDKQVQMLLHHAKVLVKRRREECLESASHQTNHTAPHNSAVVNSNGDAPLSPVISSTSIQRTSDTENELELTIDSLKPEDIRKLDMCCEVLEDNTPAPQSNEDQRERDLSPHEQERNPRNISFMTATPIECGDFQC